MTDERRDHLQTLERGLAVIAAFADRGPLLGLTELAETTGLSKPVVRRIVLTLERMGYARLSDGQYGLTPKVLTLGYAYLSSVHLTDVARPLMERFTEEHGVGTSLVALDGNDVVYIDRVQRGRITSMNLAAGTRLPAHATSSGHVLLAFATPAEREIVLKSTALAALTSATLTKASALEARLEKVRAQGWDAVDQELEYGRRSAAAPIFDHSGRIIAALSLSCSTLECTMQRLTSNFLPPLVDAASSISAALGAPPTAPRLGARASMTRVANIDR